MVDSLDLSQQKINSLQDSLTYLHYRLDNLEAQLAQSNQRTVAVQDSLLGLIQEQRQMMNDINLALKHMTFSMRYFYAEDYERALEEIQNAIKINPNIALAYARMGSIYYKINKLDLAKAAWEKALKLDPEYDDVKRVLAIVKNRQLTAQKTRKD